ncbi:MAG TPA: FHA domain-containing protein [Planctomycetaceae bacterium]|jgi:predicted component of type VI protein secretion system/anti-anti-sigma regulatory factor|nr:FHA domain-containing protein [Planctomycetaceae bacterium]
MLATERDDSALLPGMFRLALSGPDEPEPTQLAINGPIALIGREESCACRLNHPNISRRHAYLQAIFGRIFCVDLGSRTGTHWGDSARKSGWLDPGSPIRIGPYQIQMIDSIGLGQPSTPFPDNFSPLDPYGGQLGTLPRVELEILNGSVPTAEMTITRLITLVGSSPRCKLRLQHPSVAKVDCSLLWLADGLWIVDLSGRGHSRLRGKILRCARLENEQTLRLGRFHLRVHYLSGAMPSAPPQGAIGLPIPVTSRGTSPRSSGEDGLDIILAPATDEGNPDARKNARLKPGEPAQSPADEVAESLMRERRQLATDREAADARERALDAREAKLSEAQGRLASAWEHLHVDRAAYEALAADLERQRAELANRECELAGFRQSLAFEWQKLISERDASYSGHRDPVAPPTNDPAAAQDSAVWLRDPAADNFDDVSEEAAAAPVGNQHPADFDPLESVRHNKVFFADRTGSTLVVMPLGDASEFHYGDVHVESNKVRRLLEAGTFKDLVVDFGDAPVYSAVTMNVVVALSRIASNRGGRAVLCRASEKTRGLLQTMKLLDVWPLFENREDAFAALSGPPQA